MHLYLGGGKAGMRRDGLPYRINERQEHVPLRKIPFGNKEYTEDYLQSLLHRSPDILPVEELDASFSPLISLGREIDGIDNLFDSLSGRITIVETKLWRNPEAFGRWVSANFGVRKPRSVVVVRRARKQVSKRTSTGAVRIRDDAL